MRDEMQGLNDGQLDSYINYRHAKGTFFSLVRVKSIVLITTSLEFVIHICNVSFYLSYLLVLL